MPTRKLLSMVCALLGIIFSTTIAHAQEGCEVRAFPAYLYDCNPDVPGCVPRLLNVFGSGAQFEFMSGDDESDYYWVRYVEWPYWSGFMQSSSLSCEFED